jgi:N utilization substance protein B
VSREQHPHSQAREWAVQFLYQAEIEKLYFFSEAHFERFVSDFSIDRSISPYLRQLVEGVFAQLASLNEKIESVSEHWNLSRMPVVDRCVLRIAIFELLNTNLASSIVINEAIELAKKYSTENSGAFVNGLLDKIAHTLPSKI